LHLRIGVAGGQVLMDERVYLRTERGLFRRIFELHAIAPLPRHSTQQCRAPAVRTCTARSRTAVTTLLGQIIAPRATYRKRDGSTAARSAPCSAATGSKPCNEATHSARCNDAAVYYGRIGSRTVT